MNEEFTGKLQIYDATEKKWKAVGVIEMDRNESENEKAPTLKGRVILNNMVYQVSVWQNNKSQ